MQHGRRAAALVFGALLLAACSTGETEVTGGSETAVTGPTATGPTATGPTATGPTATGPTAAGAFDGPVSVDTSFQASAGIRSALYSCDGVEGTWTYIVQGGPDPIDFDINTTFDMEGGDGTLTFSDEFTITGFHVAFTDTIDIKVVGTPDAPALRATDIKVDVQSNVPGIEDIVRQFFDERQDVPVRPGAKQC